MSKIGLFAQNRLHLEKRRRARPAMFIALPICRLTYLDFLLSAAAIAPHPEKSAEHGGPNDLASVQATRQITRPNTNLGIIFAHDASGGCARRRGLAVAAWHESWQTQRRRFADGFEAIRLAQPGGLGTVAEQDVADTPTLDLRRVNGPRSRPGPDRPAVRD